MIYAFKDNNDGYYAVDVADGEALPTWTTVMTPCDVIPPEPIPVGIALVSPRQIRQALTRTNLRLAVENAVAAGDQDLKDWWEFSTTFDRDNPVSVAMARSLGVSDEQIDQLWLLAATL